MQIIDTQNIALCIIFLFGFKEYLFLFQKFELFLLFITLYSLLFQIDAFPLLVSSFFTFITPFDLHTTIELPLALGFEPVSYLKSIHNQIDSSILTLTIFFVIFIVSEGLFYRYGDLNIRRKSIHFILFAFVLVDSNVFFIVGHSMVYISAVIIKTDIIPRYFKFLIKNGEKYKDCFSFWIIMLIVVYCREILSYDGYIRLSISIFIYDSFASITGKLLKKKEKSVVGLMIGIIMASFAEIILMRNLDIQYHIIGGLVEYYCSMNDNMIVAFYSCLYEKLSMLIK